MTSMQAVQYARYSNKIKRPSFTVAGIVVVFALPFACGFSSVSSAVLSRRNVLKALNGPFAYPLSGKHDHRNFKKEPTFTPVLSHAIRQNFRLQPLSQQSDSVNIPFEAELSVKQETTSDNTFLKRLGRLFTSPTLLPGVPPIIDKVAQIVLCGLLYTFHVLVLCHKSCVLQLPFGKGQTFTASWELISGTAMFSAFLFLSGKEGRSATKAALIGDSIVGKDTLPSKASEATSASEKENIPQLLLLLGLAYLGSGYIGQFLEIFMCVLAAFGVPMTLAMCRALQVLLSHLFWVAAGSQILQKSTGNFYSRNGPWFRCDFNANLFWTVTGGYWLTSYISCVALQLNGLAGQLPIFRPLVELLQLLPESATEVVMDQIRSQDGKDLAAQIVGCLGPCFTGPIWEELLYRGFLMRALSFYMPLPLSVDVSSLLFSVNHLNARAFSHLYILGYIWAILYIKTRNLLVPILIHMMWNGRTFISPV